MRNERTRAKNVSGTSPVTDRAFKLRPKNSGGLRPGREQDDQNFLPKTTAVAFLNWSLWLAYSASVTSLLACRNLRLLRSPCYTIRKLTLHIVSFHLLISVVIIYSCACDLYARARLLFIFILSFLLNCVKYIR